MAASTKSSDKFSFESLPFVYDVELKVYKSNDRSQSPIDVLDIVARHHNTNRSYRRTIHPPQNANTSHHPYISPSWLAYLLSRVNRKEGTPGFHFTFPIEAKGDRLIIMLRILDRSTGYEDIRTIELDRVPAKETIPPTVKEHNEDNLNDTLNSGDDLKDNLNKLEIRVKYLENQLEAVSGMLRNVCETFKGISVVLKNVDARVTNYEQTLSKID